MPLRPTPDALRERAFAVLGGDVEGVRFLDLYAGTGAVGLEALSRGAERAVFVERHRGAAAILSANLDAVGATPPEVTILVRPVLAAVRRLAARGERFGMAWADPPFAAWEEGLLALQEAARLGLLPPGALACLECPEHAVVDPGDLRHVRDLAGGASRLVILRVPVP